VNRAYFFKVLLFLPIAISSQQIGNNTSAISQQDSLYVKQIVKNERQIDSPQSAVFIDLLRSVNGVGYYTVNYERHLKGPFVVGLNIGSDFGLSTGTSLSFLLCEKRHKFESQIGLGFCHHYRYNSFTEENNFFKLFSAIGYRYYKKNGFLFRIYSGIGSTFFLKHTYGSFYIPLGISFGYCF